MKLQKEDGHYYLMEDGNEVAIATTDQSFIDELGAMKLSKQNCDEIFEVVDVEKLAEENYPSGDDWTIEESLIRKLAFKNGFNKAIELNKDKMFTAEDVATAYNKGQILNIKGGQQSGKKYVQSLQQPTEIEVEIKMLQYSSKLTESEVRGFEEHAQNSGYKLEENNCIILKKKIA